MNQERYTVLGTGTIGTLLTKLLAERGSGGLVVANRSPGRLALGVPPGVKVAPNFAEAVTGASLVFLCVKPQACAGVLRAAASAALPDAVLVSTAGDVSLEFLQRLWKGPVVRLMPTVTAEVGRGVTLVCGPPEGVAKVRGAFPTAVKFLEVPEDRWNAVAAVTSCGPGLVSAMLKAWSDDAAARTGLTPAEAEALVAETAAAALALADRKGWSFPAVLEAVASPGGVTGEGARVLGERLPAVWNAVARAMDERHRARSREILKAQNSPDP